jgi:molybdate transport repressor ModE-like protein
MSLTSSRIRAVNAVFDAGSFSQAARRLGMSQPAVTQQIRSLEDRFGVTLFERRGGKLMPTALCREFVAVTSQLHGLEAQALAVLRQNDALNGGELRVGLGNAMPGMALISAFHRLYPNIQIAVEMGNWASIIDAVVDQRVDVGVLPDVPGDNRFHREIYCGKAWWRSCTQIIRSRGSKNFLAPTWPGIAWFFGPSSHRRSASWSAHFAPPG